MAFVILFPKFPDLDCMLRKRSVAWGQARPLCSKQVALESSPSGLIQPLPLHLDVSPQNYHMLFHDNMHLTLWFAISLPKKNSYMCTLAPPEIGIPLSLYLGYYMYMYNNYREA